MGVHKLIQVNGLGTLLHETPSGTMIASIVLPASSEEHSSDISGNSGKLYRRIKGRVSPSMAAEMNSTAQRKMASRNQNVLNSSVDLTGSVLRWLETSPGYYKRISYGGDAASVEEFKQLLDAAKAYGKPVYLRTSRSSIVNRLREQSFEIPENVVIGVEKHSDDELPLHGCTQIVFVDDPDAPEDLDAIPTAGDRELAVRITEECVKCAATGKPWWQRDPKDM